MHTDPRHKKRVKMMQHVFAVCFDKKNQTNYLESIQNEDEKAQVETLLKKLPQIDKQIAQVATERPLEETNKLDLAILRSTVFESIVSDTPKKVLIDEAVEMAKEFGAEGSPKFVNGVLGKILINHNYDKRNSKQTK